MVYVRTYGGTTCIPQVSCAEAYWPTLAWELGPAHGGGALEVHRHLEAARVNEESDRVNAAAVREGRRAPVQPRKHAAWASSPLGQNSDL